MLTLAIEIANPSGENAGGVALGVVATAQILAVEQLREVGRDRDDLIPAIERVMAAAGKTLADLADIAVSVGPGGFTSTRVACATGAMLAEGLGIQTRAVPSALAGHAAWVRSGGGDPSASVAVLMATKGEQAWCALIPPEPSAAAEAARSGRMMTAAGVLDFRPAAALADRHLSAPMRDVLAQAGVAIHPLRFRAQDTLAASALIPCADPSTLIPIYPREPEAVTLWRQRHGGGGAGGSDSRAKP